MTISKGISQEQEFFESHYYSHQNGPQPEFHTYHHKTSARVYFLENKASLMIFSHFKARLNFLSDRFCLDWKKLILKVFDYVSHVAIKSLEKPCFPKNNRGPRFYSDSCNIQI